MKIFCSSSLPSDLTMKKDVLLTEGELELTPFLKDGENYVGGAEMVKRAKKLGGLTGLAHAKHLLDHQGEIPVEWRNFYLVFAGCECEDSGGLSRVPFLCFLVGQWHLDFYWLDDYFFGFFQLVRLCK
jgi:hypothetical protein